MAEDSGPSKEELSEKARELDIEGRSTMNKEELAEAVAAAEGGDQSGDQSGDEVGSSQTGRIQAADALGDDDNSLRDTDEAYIGTGVEYRNAAYDTTAPLVSEDEELAAAEEAMKAAEVDRAQRGAQIGRQGHEVDLTHPSERKNASDEAYKNRVKLEEQAREEARQEASDK